MLQKRSKKERKPKNYKSVVIWCCHKCIFFIDLTCVHLRAVITQSSVLFKSQYIIYSSTILRTALAVRMLPYHLCGGAWVSVVFKTMLYYSDGPGIDSWWCHWGFFPWLPPSEPCALRSTQPLKVSARDFSWGKGSRCVWLRTTTLVVPKRQDNLGP